MDKIGSIKSLEARSGYLIRLDEHGQLVYEQKEGWAAGCYVLEPRLYSWHCVSLPDKIKTKNIEQWVRAQIEPLLGNLDGWKLIWNPEEGRGEQLWVCTLQKELLEQIKKHAQSSAYEVRALFEPKRLKESQLEVYENSAGTYVCYEQPHNFLMLYCASLEAAWEWCEQLKNHKNHSVRELGWHREQGIAAGSMDVVTLQQKIGLHVVTYDGKLKHGERLLEKAQMGAPKKSSAKEHFGGALFIGLMFVALLLFAMGSLLDWHHVKMLRDIQRAQTQSLVKEKAPSLGVVIDLKKQLEQYAKEGVAQTEAFPGAPMVHAVSTQLGNLMDGAEKVYATEQGVFLTFKSSEQALAFAKKGVEKGLAGTVTDRQVFFPNEKGVAK